MALPPRRSCGVTVTADSGFWPLSLPPWAGASPYLRGPIAMNQDREGVVGKVPRSHVAHLKLEHDLIWGSENTDTSSVRPRGQAQILAPAQGVFQATNTTSLSLEFLRL